MRKKTTFQLSLIMTLGLVLNTVHAEKCTTRDNPTNNTEKCQQCESGWSLGKCINFCKAQRDDCIQYSTADNKKHACCGACLQGSDAYVKSGTMAHREALDACMQ